MTPEAKAAVMQLMGQTYGQMKKQDEMIVGSSAQLQGKSHEMKDLVQQLVATPTVNAPNHPPQPQGPPPQQAPQPEAAPVPTGPPAATITPEQAQMELQAAAAPVAPAPVAPVAPAPVQVEQTMEFDFSEPTGVEKLIELQKETNLLLKDIKLTLENSNVRPKRKSAVKKASAKVA